MIDLSADLGEGAPGEGDIWPLISSANVACGGHAGDEASMSECVRRARQNGVRLGAHPSYPDRESFGRKTMAMPAEELRAALVSQLDALQRLAPLRHVKPHGALYNDAHARRELAAVIVDAMCDVDRSAAIVCADRSQMAVVARERGVAVIREAFADRRYEPDGSLVPRSVAGSTLTIDEAASQAYLLTTEGVVIARNGARLAMPFDTLCVHADMENAAERLKAIRARLA